MVVRSVSPTRRQYILRLIGRGFVFLICIFCCFLYPQVFSVLEGNSFFNTLSPLHLLWVVWVIDMFLQIVPVKNKVALGLQKLFANRFKPIREKINYKALNSIRLRFAVS